MKTTIFPYVFGRKGGVPFNVLSSLQAPRLADAVQQLSDQRLHAGRLGENINQVLYYRINELQDSPSQNLLLNLKRDIYNNRDIAQYPNKGLDGDDEMLGRLLQEYTHSRSNLMNLEAVVDELYNEATADSVRWLREIAGQRFLKNGLLFSSDSVYQNVEKFTSGNQRRSNKKEQPMASSLLRYLTRSAAKTSPFSSFNSIFALEKKSEAWVPVEVGKNTSILSISNLVYLLLKKILLAEPCLKRTFVVSLNPTLENTTSTINYFYNHDNDEAFYEVQAPAILTAITNFLTSHASVSYADVCQAVEEMSEEAPERVSAYVDQLVSTGVLILQFPVSAKDKEWPHHLLSRIKSFVFKGEEQEIANALIALLSQLLRATSLLAHQADTHKRYEICHQAYQCVREQVACISKKIDFQEIAPIVKKLSPASLFYEDTLTESVNSIDSDSTSASLGKISYLHQLLQKHSFKNEVRKSLATKLKASYGTASVPLLTCYREVYLADKEPEKAIHDHQRTLLNVLSDFFQSLPHQLKNDRVDIAPHLVDITSPKSVSTLDLFTQLADADGRSTLVVNNILSGAATHVSRFINLYPTRNISEDIKSKVEALHKNKMVAELVDASIHNANTFPCLAGHVIDVSLQGSTYQRAIHLNELFVRVDDQQGIAIENRQGIQVVPIDFSMESIQRKSSLMKFIDLFSDTNSEGTSTLLQLYEEVMLSNIFSDQIPVGVIPRLYYSDDIILSRKKWMVRKAFLVQLLAENLSESMQFVAFTGWRKRLEIPDHVFVKISKFSQSSSHRKPQYIDLSAPLLFSLFKKLLKKGDDVIEIAEMLPTPEQLAKNQDENPYVVEYIFNLSTAD